MRKINKITEKKILAMIARGDRYADISQEVGLSVSGIKKVKKRNPISLAKMEEIITEKQAISASRLLEKSHREIEKKLDKALAGEEDIKLRDLVGVSKEMFNQVQIEHGKPTSIATSSTQDPLEAKKELKSLLKALKANDAVELQRIIFKPKDYSQP